MKIIRLSQTHSLRASSRMLDSFLSKGTPTARVPELLNTLLYLSGIGKTGDVAPYLTTAYKPYLENMVFLKSIIRVPDIYRLLSRFEPIMDELIRQSIGASTHLKSSDVIADITDIVRTSGTADYGTRTQQYPMFQKLFQKFTGEIGNAANAVGNTSLATAIRSNGLLNLAVISNAFKLGKPLPYMFSTSKELIRDIMSHRYETSSTNINQNYEIIKEKLMRPIGVIGAKQQEQMEIERKQEELSRIDDPSKIAPGASPPSSLEEAKPYSVNEKQLTDPYFIMALFVFFTEYAKIVQSLPA